MGQGDGKEGKKKSKPACAGDTLDLKRRGWGIRAATLGGGGGGGWGVGGCGGGGGFETSQKPTLGPVLTS